MYICIVTYIHIIYNTDLHPYIYDTSDRRRRGHELEREQQCGALEGGKTGGKALNTVLLYVTLKKKLK